MSLHSLVISLSQLGRQKPTGEGLYFDILSFRMSSFQELEFKNVVAPITAGVAVSATLFGCAIVQTNSYYKSFPADSWLLKALVVTEMLLQLVRTALLTAGIWQVAVVDYEQSQLQVFIPTSLATVIILSAPIAFLVQATFSVLLYRLSRRPILFTIHLFLTASRFVLHIAIGVASYGTRNTGELVQQWYWCIVAILILSIICDTFVTASLTYRLKIQKIDFTQPSQVIDLIIVFTFATGLLTSAAELTTVVCLWALPGNCTWMSLWIAVSGLYTVSFLAALNQRGHFCQLLPGHDCGCTNRTEGNAQGLKE